MQALQSIRQATETVIVTSSVNCHPIIGCCVNCNLQTMKLHEDSNL